MATAETVKAVAAAITAGSTISVPGMMAATSSPFSNRNLFLCSSFSPRSVILPSRIPRLAMSSKRAYDMVMMDQLLKRKKGVAYGSIQIMCISTLGHADWKPLQFLCFAYFYRILEKLKATEPTITPIYNEYGEVEGQGIHTAKRVLRSLGLVLGSILAASMGYTGLANFSQFLGEYIPSVVYNFQELIVTTASSVLLCILASYWR